MFPNNYAMFCATLASLTFFAIGYDEAVITKFVVYLQEDLRITDNQYDMLMGCTYISAIIGCIIVGILSDWKGRQFTIIMSGGLISFGAIGISLANSYEILMLTRFAMGIGIGAGLTITPVYIVELSSPSNRGFLCCIPEALYSTGYTLGFVMYTTLHKLSSHLQWRISMGLTTIPSLLMILGLLAMLESPYWLAMQGRFTDAFEVISRYTTSEIEINHRLNHLGSAIAVSIDVTRNDVIIPPHIRGERIIWREFLYPTPALQRILASFVGLCLLQRVVALNTIIFYTYKVLKNDEYTSEFVQYGMIGILSFKTICMLIPIFTMDKIGRRLLLLFSIGAMAVSLGLLGLSLVILHRNHAHFKPEEVKINMACIITYITSFAIGLGPITWFYSSEVVSYRVRAQGVSIGVVANRVADGCLLLISTRLHKLLTDGVTFIILTAIIVFGFSFCYKYIRETKGQNIW